MEKQKPPIHIHWTTLVNSPKVIKYLEQGIVMIVIKPLTEQGYDCQAEIYKDARVESKKGPGGTFKHQLDCTWVEV